MTVSDIRSNLCALKYLLLRLFHPNLIYICSTILSSIHPSSARSPLLHQSSSAHHSFPQCHWLIFPRQISSPPIISTLYANTLYALSFAKRMSMELINELSPEKRRWLSNLSTLETEKLNVIGDCLLTASFLTYAGCFSQPLRNEMLLNDWLSDIHTKHIPIAINFNVLQPNYIDTYVCFRTFYSAFYISPHLSYVLIFMANSSWL